MKRIPVMGAFFCLVLSASARAGAESDLPALNVCVAGLEAQLRTFRFVPPEILFADKRLQQMVIGVPIQRENFELLARRESATFLDRHLLANAVEGCRLYSAQLRTRAFWFLSFTASMVLFLVVFGAHFLVIGLGPPVGKPERNDVKSGGVGSKAG